MKNEFELAFNEIAEVRMLAPELVLEALQTALISAYRRDANASSAQRVDAHIEPGTGRARIYVEKEVVEDVFNPNTEVDLEKARYYDPEANLGDMVMVQVEGTTKKFGRIAAQTAKQVILQKIREAERNALYEEFVTKEGDILNAQVQSMNSHFVTVSLNGRAEAMLPRAQQIPNERYKPGDKIRVYILEVKKSPRGPQIVVSRSHRNMLKRLLEFEVPEIYNGQVEIKNIAREAGGRSKVAVAALQDGIDPVGACVGMRGIRIQNIVKELHDEKIDVIEWNPNQETFIQKALSPARVTGVYLEDDPDMGRTAVVVVPDDQLSLAIGREGQNARLAAKLTGWRIDIKSVAEAVSTALEQIKLPSLAELKASHGETVEDVTRILEKKAAGLAVMPEEYTTLSKFADVVERRLLGVRNEARQARIEEINAVRGTLPQHAFAIPVTNLDLPDTIIEALQPLESVGEILLRFLIDEGRIRRLLSGLPHPDNAMTQLQSALDRLVIPEDDVIVEQVSASEAVATKPSDSVMPQTPAQPAQAGEELSTAAAAVSGEATAVTDPRKAQREFIRDEPEAVAFDEDDDDDAIDKDDKKGKKKKKDRDQRRQLVFDEELGEVVVRRNRKGGRTRDEWDDYKK